MKMQTSYLKTFSVCLTTTTTDSIIIIFEQNFLHFFHWTEFFLFNFLILAREWPESYQKSIDSIWKWCADFLFFILNETKKSIDFAQNHLIYKKKKILRLYISSQFIWFIRKNLSFYWFFVSSCCLCVWEKR